MKKNKIIFQTISISGIATDYYSDNIIKNSSHTKYENKKIEIKSVNENSQSRVFKLFLWLLIDRKVAGIYYPEWKYKIYCTNVWNLRQKSNL